MDGVLEGCKEDGGTERASAAMRGQLERAGIVSIGRARRSRVHSK
jgi:hypothetical protein